MVALTRGMYDSEPREESLSAGWWRLSGKAGMPPYVGMTRIPTPSTRISVLTEFTAKPLTLGPML